MKDKVNDSTQSVKIDKLIVKAIKRYILDNGGTIRSFLEDAAFFKMGMKINRVKK